MASKRKSVTFRENVSVVYPKTFDGSSSPAPITTTPATALPSLQLDPMYLTWLRSATKAQYPFIVNGTFAKYIYHQNFDQHYNMKHSWHFQKVQERETAVPALAEKYGSLGWGNLYQRVTKEAWAKNYRVGTYSSGFGWTGVLIVILGRRSIDLMALMSSYWRRLRKPMTKCVARKLTLRAKS